MVFRKPFFKHYFDILYGVANDSYGAPKDTQFLKILHSLVKLFLFGITGDGIKMRWEEKLHFKRFLGWMQYFCEQMQNI